MAPNIQDAKCIFVVGATSGIGRALALALLDLPQSPTVIITGRREERLREIAQQHQGKKLEHLRVDIDANTQDLKAFVDSAIAKFPDIDAVILNAGIQRAFDFTNPESVNFAHFASELNTNYTAPVTLITYFLPHFLKLSASGRPSFIIPVTSGLALRPLPGIPNYCATKAALHSFMLSLNSQLYGTNVHITEIIPPLVESELHDHEGTTDRLSRIWMPLDEFTAKMVDGLKTGNLHIFAGDVVENYKKYNEAGKIEDIEAMRKRFSSIV